LEEVERTVLGKKTKKHMFWLLTSGRERLRFHPITSIALAMGHDARHGASRKIFL